MLNFKLIQNAIKHKQATNIFLLFVISAFAIFAMMLINDVYVATKLENNWTVIEHVYQKAESEAVSKNLEATKWIDEQVTKYYAEDPDGLVNDFENIHQINKLTKILNDSITDSYIFGIQNDNNDPFIMNKERIITDNSFNCSRVLGQTRDFTQEISVHFNPILGEKAIDNIINENTSTQIIWSFLPVDKELPWYDETKKLEYVDMVVLKELYMKYNGDIRVLANYEFLVPHFIYKNTDLIGNPAVSEIGLRTDNYQLTLVQGFNIVDVIKQANYTPLLEQNNLAVKTFTAMILLISVALVSLCLIFFLITWRGSKH